MIRQIETNNFRMLAANRVPLARFQVLVGQNATGKTTLLDAIRFISDLITGGVRKAVEVRAPSVYDLCYDPARPLGLAIEIMLPAGNGESAHFRYEIEIGIAAKTGLRVLRENLFRIAARSGVGAAGQCVNRGETIAPERPPNGWRKIVAKTAQGRDYFRDERTDWNNLFRFGEDRPALGSLPDDPDRFPFAIEIRNLLRDGIRALAPEPRKLGLAAAPGGGPRLELDGSNLPYVVRDLKQRDPHLFGQWVRHLATGVPGLIDVDVAEREEDKHLVLRAVFSGRQTIPTPSWLLSDGTLRLMALTLVSYATPAESRDVFLIEEPENGLHPLAIQTAFEALSDPVQNIQVLCATHSPVFLSQVNLDQSLVFRRAEAGHASVLHGPDVPELADWTGRCSVADLFAIGVLA